jgi:hypothetical protein
LRELYARSGRLRVPPDDRHGDEGPHRCKRWYELRLKAWDFSELAEMVRLLRVVGIEAGRSYVTLGRPVIPIYGEQRVRQAIRDLRLERVPKRRVDEPNRTPRAGHFMQGRKLNTLKQFEVAMRLYTKGPLTAAGLHTNGSLLTGLERRGLVEPVPSGARAIWRLTSAGRRETRRYRKAYYAWRRRRR